MTVLALITNAEELRPIIAWGSQFAAARETTLTVLCWSQSQVDQFPLLADSADEHDGDLLVDQVHRLLSETAADDPLAAVLLPESKVYVRRLTGPDPVAGILRQTRIENPDLLVVVGAISPAPLAVDRARTIVRHSPCRTIILYTGGTRALVGKRLFVGITDHSTTIIGWIG